VFARSVGLVGDVQADLKNHGGLEKAVYFYPAEHYEAWKNVLGTSSLGYGSLGENLTSQGLDETNVRVGDVFRIGNAIFRVRQPRFPCYKLQIKFERSDMVDLFIRQALPGWYASVIEEGSLCQGDEIEIVEDAGDGISIADIWRYALSGGIDEETMDRIQTMTHLPSFWKERIARKFRSSSQ